MKKLIERRLNLELWGMFRDKLDRRIESQLKENLRDIFEELWFKLGLNVRCDVESQLRGKLYEEVD
jgi:hypothetical protein